MYLSERTFFAFQKYTETCLGAPPPLFNLLALFPSCLLCPTTEERDARDTDRFGVCFAPAEPSFKNQYPTGNLSLGWEIWERNYT
jgi:hypothetical protein